jgi:hypothetical protein
MLFTSKPASPPQLAPRYNVCGPTTPRAGAYVKLLSSEHLPQPLAAPSSLSTSALLVQVLLSVALAYRPSVVSPVQLAPVRPQVPATMLWPGHSVTG